jgi:hypothetical protein
MCVLGRGWHMAGPWFVDLTRQLFDVISRFLTRHEMREKALRPKNTKLCFLPRHIIIVIILLDKRIYDVELLYVLSYTYCLSFCFLSFRTYRAILSLFRLCCDPLSVNYVLFTNPRFDWTLPTPTQWNSVVARRSSSGKWFFCEFFPPSCNGDWVESLTMMTEETVLAARPPLWMSLPEGEHFTIFPFRMIPTYVRHFYRFFPTV